MRAFLAALFVGGSILIAQTTQPTTRRSVDQIEADLGVADDALTSAMHQEKGPQTPEARQKAAPVVLPDLRTMIGLFQELRQTNPDMDAEINLQLVQLRTLQLVYGDPPVQASNAKAAANGDALAGGERAVADYICASNDAARMAAIAAFGTAIKRDPANDTLVGLLNFLVNIGVDGKTPSDQITGKLLEVARNDARGPAAGQIADLLDSQLKLHALLGKPITLSEVKMDGTPFSTADWKGKVILVDFWATWCPTCVAELPEIEKLYQQYHGQGFEVLGVSSDYGIDDLKKYLAGNPAMVWPQLFDVKAPGMNVLATQHGIVGLPALFIIDRNGVLRHIDAEMAFNVADLFGTLHQIIPQLLAEKAK